MATKLICDRCGKETDELYQFESNKVKDLSNDFSCDETEYTRSKELCTNCKNKIWECINNV